MPLPVSTLPATRALARTILGLCLAGLVLVAPAMAQDSQTRALIDRIDRLQREVTDLPLSFTNFRE